MQAYLPDDDKGRDPGIEFTQPAKLLCTNAFQLLQEVLLTSIDLHHTNTWMSNQLLKQRQMLKCNLTVQDFTDGPEATITQSHERRSGLAHEHGDDHNKEEKAE